MVGFLFNNVFLYLNLGIDNKNIILMEIEINCVNCNKEFIVPYKQRKRKFCSRSCFFEHGKKNNSVGRKKDETIREVRKCKVCGDEFESKKKHKKEICSDKCRVVWGKKNVVKQKRIEKTKKTNLDRYGVDHVWKVPSIHKKTINNTNKVESVKKQKETVRIKYLKKLTNKLKDNKLTILDNYTTNKSGSTTKHYKFKCSECDNVFTSTLLGSGIIPKCRVCEPIIKNSSMELEVEKYLNKNGIKYIKNDRKLIKPKEVDFYLPDHNLAIELNGLYWHTETNGKTKNYHINKTQNCNKKGVKLIHIFSDEFNTKKDVIFSMLNNQLGLNNKRFYARKCTIKEITPKDKKIFLNNNHIQGDARSSINLGLFYNGELVSVITIGRRKINRGDVKWEIIRFSTKLGVTVVGGFSKLLSHIRNNYDCQSLMTYADIRWSGLEFKEVVYHKTGFNYLGRSKPNYWYIKDGYDVREHRYKYRKSELIKKGYDSNKTEIEIMSENGYSRVWDCGNLRFEICF